MGKCRAPEGGESFCPSVFSVTLRRGRRSAPGREPSSTVSLLCPQVAKLRHQLQKRSRHAPPTAGYELSQPPLPARQAAGITQVALSLSVSDTMMVKLTTGMLESDVRSQDEKMKPTYQPERKVLPQTVSWDVRR